MGLLKKSDSSVSKKYEPTPSIKKYNYRQYLESQSKPSEAILNTASKYSDKAASSAALQIQLESETKKRNPSERKRRSFCGFGRVWFQLLALLQVLGAVAVIAITAGCIDKNIDASLTNNTNATSVSTNALCYTVNSSVNTCTYIYWSSGISIILSVLLALWNMCCAGKRGKCCVSMEAFIALLGCAWWIAAGTVGMCYIGSFCACMISSLWKIHRCPWSTRMH